MGGCERVENTPHLFFIYLFFFLNMLSVCSGPQPKPKSGEEENLQS